MIPANPIRILFVGEIQSTHAQSWIRLLDGHGFDIRCFAISRGAIAPDFEHSVIYTGKTRLRDWPRRRGLPAPLVDLLSALSIKAGRDLHAVLGKRLLGRLIRSFRPHILHCFGASYGGLFALSALEKADLIGATRLVVQVRGGPDLLDGLTHPRTRNRLDRLFRLCDLLICDNPANYRIATDHGCAPDRQFERSVPGTGGFNIPDIPPTPPSGRSRLLFIPKAYEGYQSKVLPMLEGLHSVWDQLQPITILMTAVNPEAENAIRRLPAEIQAAIQWHDRVDRGVVMEAMRRARVMLAPSVMDGIPNVLYEAMLGGAAPVVSPLSGLTPLFENERHLLYARNLFPDEIGAAVVRLMVDDALADRIALANRSLLSQLADRMAIRGDVVTAYRRLALGEASGS